MVTGNTDIRTRVIAVIAMCTDLSPNQLASAHWQEPLTGCAFGLFAVDLVYIFFELEKEFNIQFPSSSLEKYGLSSIGGMCSAVQDILEHA